MTGHSYSDEIALTLDQAKHYIRRMGSLRITTEDSNAALECIDQALKLIEAEWAALMAEIHDREGDLVRATTECEQGRKDTHWVPRVENWRGDDFFEGAAPEDRSQM